MPTIGYDAMNAADIAANPALARDYLQNAIDALLEGDTETGRVMLRHYVNGTIGFAELGRRVNRDPKNLMRSLGPKGNPTATNLLAIIRACAEAGKVTIRAQVGEQGSRSAQQPG